LMMAMTIFMGSPPRLGPSLRVQVVGNLRCALTREISLRPAMPWPRIKPRASSPHRP
jgi:hypothetical protein